MKQIKNSFESIERTCLLNLRLAALDEQMHYSELFNIGTALGLYERQTILFVQDVMNNSAPQYLKQKQCLTFRIWLIKKMVHKCLFYIGSELCSQPLQFENSKNFYLPHMPISYWAVYKLHHSVGLSHAEIAIALNTTPLQIRARLNKALEYNQKQ